jgi:uncharacterized protein YigE (DUF2233 family)
MVKKFIITTIIGCVSYLHSSAQYLKVFRIYQPESMTWIKKIDTKKNKSPLILSGPLMDYDDNPIGGYAEKGKLIKKWEIVEENLINKGPFYTNNGIFGITKDGTCFLELLTPNQIPQTNNILWAFQNGPCILYNGKILPQPTDKELVTAAIGFDDRDIMYGIVSIKPVSLEYLAKIFMKIGCKNAIVLGRNLVDIGYRTIGLDIGSYGLGCAKCIKMQFDGQIDLVDITDTTSLSR